MEDRPRAHDHLGAQAQVLDLSEFAITQHRLQRRHFAQHEDAVETCLLGELAGVAFDAGMEAAIGSRATGARRPTG